MSAIALVNLVSVEKLDRYLKTGGDWKAVLADSEELSYRWSGYVFATLVPYLDAQGIALSDPREEPLSAEREMSCFVLTTAHRHYLDRLAPERFDGRALRAYFEEFNETTAEGIERAMLAGIELIRDALTRVNDDTVCVIAIDGI